MIVEKKNLYSGFFKMNRVVFNYTTAAGKTVEIVREIFERGHAVAVLPYDPVLKKVLLIKQFLPGNCVAGLNPEPLQVIAGMIDKETDPKETARRESVEEAGLVVKDLKTLTTYLPSPGGSSETITLFLATCDLSEYKEGLYGLEEENENITTHLVDVDNAMKIVENGEMINGPALTALLWLKAFIV